MPEKYTSASEASKMRRQASAPVPPAHPLVMMVGSRPSIHNRTPIPGRRPTLSLSADELTRSQGRRRSAARRSSSLVSWSKTRHAFYTTSLCFKRAQDVSKSGLGSSADQGSRFLRTSHRLVHNLPAIPTCLQLLREPERALQ